MFCSQAKEPLLSSPSLDAYPVSTNLGQVFVRTMYLMLSSAWSKTSGPKESGIGTDGSNRGLRSSKLSLSTPEVAAPKVVPVSIDIVSPWMGMAVMDTSSFSEPCSTSKGREPLVLKGRAVLHGTIVVVSVAAAALLKTLLSSLRWAELRFRGNSECCMLTKER